MRESLSAFIAALSGVEGSGHIKPLHWSIACTLVLEGGFRPEWITPRPPFVIEPKGSGASRRLLLHHEPKAAGSSERTVLGGLKTKAVDVVVALEGIGPCLAVSVKGTLNAFRNLTNRMEEAVGDCTNLHIAYPALVYGFFSVLRATREGPLPPNASHFLKPDDAGNVKAADVAVWANGEVSESIRRYHQALSGLSARRGIRNDLTRYEAVALVLASPGPETLGEIVTTYPLADSQLLASDFFRRLYDQYDQRFVYGAPELARVTRRAEWDADSPALKDERAASFKPQVSAGPLPPPLPDHAIPEHEEDEDET